MPSLLPSGSEQRFISDSINEALDLFGQQVLYFHHKEYSLYLDNPTLSTGVGIKVLMQNNPQRKLLNNLGWFREDTEDSSIVIFLPYQVGGTILDIQKFDVMLFDDGMSLMITRVNRQYLYGLWNICMCVPYEKDNPALAETYDKDADVGKCETVEETFIKTNFNEVSDEEFAKKMRRTQRTKKDISPYKP